VRICSTVAPVLSHADRQKAYRDRQGDKGKTKNAARMRTTRANALPTFIGVDSEGIGRGSDHRAVLLGVGDQHYIARDQAKGLHWSEVFTFLYEQHKRKPNAAFVGFYLSYDFNHWLRYLPLSAAYMLLTNEGRAARKMKRHGRVKSYRREFHPVRIDGWEIDMMGFKRLSIRPRPVGCNCHAQRIKCFHRYEPWMHICDAGAFFQMAFLDVLNPEKWKDDPSGPVCTEAEYKSIAVNKARRSEFHQVDQEMIYYNGLENKLLAVCMDRLASGFKDVGIKIAKDQWYGPGATASKWLQLHNAPKRKDLESDLMPEWFREACRRSYYGGWFEIFSHGIIYGKSWNYDINNAYPYATTKLPHICDDCQYQQGEGQYLGDSPYVLVKATIYGGKKRTTRIGPMPYRRKDGSILRPDIVTGWYWQHEIDASYRAGLITKAVYHEWVAFIPCTHDEPFTEVRTLYDKRLRVGKDSAQGMAIKLNNNSLYGKFAQAVGGAPFNNWFYASYITSHCRTQILEAIATHPGGAESVLMVATDGICFDSPHPSLPVSKRLGEWAETIYYDLALFKPGVYWHREGKEKLVKVKSRGVPRAAFAQNIDAVEMQFARWHLGEDLPGVDLGNPINERIDGQTIYLATQRLWPAMLIPVSFRMKTCKQAIQQGSWNTACETQEEVKLLQDSDPDLKRRFPVWNSERQRLDTYIHHLPPSQQETTYYQEAIYPEQLDLGFGFEGEATSPLLEMVAAIRGKPANYDIDLGAQYEWETVYDNGKTL